MDDKIIKAIIHSCDVVAKNLDNSEDFQELLKEEKYIPNIDIFKAMCTSLSKLLSYKVSKEAYQRYSVRIQDVLREWCTVGETFQHHTFMDEQQTLKFVEILLRKHLTDKILDNCCSDVNLIPLTSALTCLASKDSYHMDHIEKLLEKLVQLELSAESKSFLCYAINKRSNLNLKLHTIENIYICQKCKLVEQPLLDYFTSVCTSLTENNNGGNSKSTHLLEQLLEFTCESSRIFQLVCVFLKELLVQLNYIPLVTNFIERVLKRIATLCENQNKSMLDLYPRNLHACIILLQIDPLHHTAHSKSSTLQLLQNIYTQNKDVLIILLSHFPLWLQAFGEYMIQNSDKFR